MKNFVKLGLASVLFVAGCAILLLSLASDVNASTADSAQAQSCGAALTVLRTGSGYESGEYFSDQTQFDERCVDSARQRVGPAVAAGFAAVVSLVFVGSAARNGHLAAKDAARVQT